MDEPVINFLNLRNKICGTFRCIHDSNEVLCMCHYVIFIRFARIATSGRALSSASARPIIRRHYASRGWRG
jgi:hypothetical protein